METPQADYILMRQDHNGLWWFPGAYDEDMTQKGREGVSWFTKQQTGVEVPPDQWLTPWEELDEEDRLCYTRVASGAGETGFLKEPDEYSQGAAVIPVMLLFTTLLLIFSGAGTLAGGP